MKFPVKSAGGNAGKVSLVIAIILLSYCFIYVALDSINYVLLRISSALSTYGHHITPEAVTIAGMVLLSVSLGAFLSTRLFSLSITLNAHSSIAILLFNMNIIMAALYIITMINMDEPILVVAAMPGFSLLNVASHIVVTVAAFAIWMLSEQADE